MKYVLLMLTFILFSCAKEEEKKTTTKIAFTQQSIGAATQLGGVLVFGRRLSPAQGMFVLPLNSENDIEEVVIPRGLWEIAAVSWEGPAKMQGGVRCAKTPPTGVKINQDQMTVSLDLSDTKCADPAFGIASSKEVASGYSNQPKALEVFNCFDKDGFIEGPKMGSCSSFGGGSTAQSFRIGFKRFDPYTGLAPSPKVASACIQSFTSGVLSTALRIPFFHSSITLPMEVRTYPKASCQGTPAIVHFDQGLKNPVPGKGVFQTTALGNTLSINYDICESFDDTANFALSTGSEVYICNISHFQQLVNAINGGSTTPGMKAHLLQSINFNGATFSTPLGESSTNEFNIEFEGHGNKLSNFTMGAACNPSGNTGDGFIRYASEGGLYNLTIENFTITGGSIASDCDEIGLIGQITQPDNSSFEIERVKVFGFSVTGRNNVGGFVGYSDQSACTTACNLDIIESELEGTITADNGVGGLIGNIYTNANNGGTKLDRAEFMGWISGEATLGGLIGNAENAKIMQSKATSYNYSPNNDLIKLDDGGAAVSRQLVGGLVGSSLTTDITKSHAIGKIKYDAGNSAFDWDYVGGLVGADTLGVGAETIISYSSSNTPIIADGEYHGGLIGSSNNYNTSINASHAHGDLAEKTAQAATNIKKGGLAGYLKGNIKNSYYSGGTIKGAQFIGGLVGSIASHFSDNSKFGEIKSSYIKSASVYGNTDVGGVAGWSAGKIIGVYSDADVFGLGSTPNSNPTKVAGIVGYQTSMIACSGCVSSTVDQVVSTGTVTDLSGSGVSFQGGISVTNVINVGLTTSDVFFNDSNYTTANSAVYEATINGDDCATASGSLDCVNYFDFATGNARSKLNVGIDTFEYGDGGLPVIINITTAAQLNAIKDNPILMGKHFKLTNSITLGATFNMIGSTTHPFVGHFEGHPTYTISNLNISESGVNNVGMFAVVGDSIDKIPGRIGDPDKPLKITSSSVTGQASVGTVAGELRAGHISARVTDALVSFGGTVDTGIGGIVGVLGDSVNTTFGTISDSLFEGEINVSTSDDVGGIVGRVEDGELNRLKASLKITDSGDRVGGIVGRMGNGNIKKALIVPNPNLSNNFINSSGQFIGGAIGDVIASGNFTYEQISSYIDITTSADGTVGGVIGKLMSSPGSSTYNLISLNAQDIDITKGSGTQAASAIFGTVLAATINVENCIAANVVITGATSSVNTMVPSASSSSYNGYHNITGANVADNDLSPGTLGDSDYDSTVNGYNDLDLLIPNMNNPKDWVKINGKWRLSMEGQL